LHNCYFTFGCRISHIQKRSISPCSSYGSDDDEPEALSAQTRGGDDVTSGVDSEPPLMSVDDVISEIESMMEEVSSFIHSWRRTKFTACFRDIFSFVVINENEPSLL